MIPCLNPATAWLPEPEKFIELASVTGFRAVDAGADFWAEWVNRTSLDYVNDFCARHQCVIGHGGLCVNFRESAETFEQDLALLPAICKINKALGIQGMCTWILPATREDITAFRNMHVSRLSKVADILADHGLRLGLEFVGPKTCRLEGTPFVYNMDGMLELCAEVHEDACGLLFDSYHWYTSHGTVEDILALEARDIVHVHINDAYPGIIDELQDMKRLLPGEGVINLSGFLESLKKIGYTGPVSVETFSEELRNAGPQEAARRAGKALLRVMQGFMEK